MGAFEHVHDIVFFGNFLLLDLQDVWIQAKLALPEGLIRLELGFHLRLNTLFVFFSRQHLGVLIQNRITLFALIRVTTRKVLLCGLHSIKGHHKHIEILLCFGNYKSAECLIGKVG